MSWRGNLSRNLKELRFLFCQTSPTSAQTRHLYFSLSFQWIWVIFLSRFNPLKSITIPLLLALRLCRQFVLKNYKDLKTMNPKFPILIRECSGVDPQLWARYGNLFSFYHLRHHNTLILNILNLIILFHNFPQNFASLSFFLSIPVFRFVIIKLNLFFFPFLPRYGCREIRSIGWLDRI